MPSSPAAPSVSVIMPVFNAAVFLQESIGSVTAQTFADWELIAVDDGSRDDSLPILNRLAAADPRIRVLTGPNQGVAQARNQAMQAATGRYLAFLDADDLWHPRKLELQLAAMQAAGSVFSCTAYLRHNQDTGRKTVIGVPPRASRADLLKTNTVPCSTAMIDSAHFGPRRMPTGRGREDFLFWLELLTATPSVLGVPVVLMTYRQHGASQSAAKAGAAADTWAMYRQALGLPLLPALWLFGNYALRGLLRHRAPALARRLGWLHSARIS